MAKDPRDLTLDEVRVALAPVLADAVAFDGWSEAAVRAAARQVGVDEDVAAYAFGEGAMAMIAGFSAYVDAAMAEGLPHEALMAMKVRERIRALVSFRLKAWFGREEALRRALAIMASPRHAAAAARLGWASADTMWRLAGDVATDYNHYTKRATLAGIYAATLAVLVDDESEDHAQTMAFLDRRIEGIMHFEKLKARVLSPDREHFSVVRLLGRLRYPAH
ncbi:MAG: COQ9 family protein [Sphingomonadales bacterium]|nr:COQ9 family protein [Sphingomonadales bacterium]MDE2171626.1 COQ9 family protein [Sphingomonadales bacterium]